MSDVERAQSWDDVERLMYADEPINFLLEGEPAAALRWRFPAAKEAIDVLRRDPDCRVQPGRSPAADRECEPTRTAPGALSILETRDGVHHFGTGEAEAKFSEWFRSAPIDDAIAAPFSLAHFQLSKYFERGAMLSDEVVC